jgi:hypothetical protein
MQRRGEFPIEQICSFYSYSDIDKALEDMHKGSVSVVPMFRGLWGLGTDVKQIIKAVIEW